MAERPVFIPEPQATPFVREEILEFEWFPGFSKSQKQKSIQSLHQAAARKGILPVLEISSKSDINAGVYLSAFNLMLSYQGKKMTVECAFQGSKVFQSGGPFQDLYDASSLEAKRDQRLRKFGQVTGFQFFDLVFPTRPMTLFYDWLYLNALIQNPDLAKVLKAYQGFSDIEFNPKKSINCQAKAAALYVALEARNQINEAVGSGEAFSKGWLWILF